MPSLGLPLPPLAREFRPSPYFQVCWEKTRWVTGITQCDDAPRSRECADFQK